MSWNCHTLIQPVQQIVYRLEKHWIEVRFLADETTAL
jgi:hypothetical protein